MTKQCNVSLFPSLENIYNQIYSISSDIYMDVKSFRAMQMIFAIQLNQVACHGSLNRQV